MKEKAEKNWEICKCTIDEKSIGAPKLRERNLALVNSAIIAIAIFDFSQLLLVKLSPYFFH